MRWPRLVAGGLVLLAGLGGAALGVRLLARPDFVPTGEPSDPGAGFRVQQSLAEILLRQGGASRRVDPVVLETAELNAFLSRHLESRRLGLRPVVVRGGDGQLEIGGRTSVRELLAGSAGESLIDLLPGAPLDAEVWLSVRGRLIVRDGQAELAVEQARVGRQPVPPRWLWGLLGVDPREILHWRVPRVVERIEARRDRVVVHTRPGGG
ncbi:MAG: hypothetical protein HYV62_17500 [Candidatus Rokubacteria bacterium]|nr:hypothetical protein [Candidatus Rokubacteria bacterium]